MEKGKIRRLEQISDELKVIQEHFIKEAEENTDFYMDSYINHPSSLSGRYVCSDLFKETFPEYIESLESRKKYSSVIHNSAAVLANEMFYKNIKNPNIKKGIFLSGIPGAGKSFLVQSLALSGAIGDDTLIYEGDINSPTIFEKIEAVKAAGIEIHIVIVNPTIELAQTNAINRSLEIGRGASCETMARIMSKIPESLKIIQEKFPESDLAIYNKKTNYDIDILYGYDNIDILFHGTYEQILNQLQELRLQILKNIKKKIEQGEIDKDGQNKKRL